LDPDDTDRHRTDSVDIVIVIEGEVTRELDDRAKAL
jgi:hypothetical protein